ncbi:MAG: molecular chaperone GrpE [Candidatus Tokpelaia sp. JSC085]|nr:MAG: molecular chaperone GrpE [Candidatus Tokpelaia sp. JSC085]
MSGEKNVDENALSQLSLKEMKDDEALQSSEKDPLEDSCQGNMEITKEDNLNVSDKVSAAALEKLEVENAELNDKIMRIAADMENLRRRTIRDVADSKSYSIANFARDMLSVSDNFARAIAALPKDNRENDLRLKAFAEGLEMTERSMHAVLQQHGVQKIEPYGQKFDPNFHQAIFEIDDRETPVNTIKQVIQPGYMIGERVLRPAMVGVTKGGMKVEDKSQKSADETQTLDEN